MKLEDINIRDPFVLPFHNVYYMYGTRAKTCWGPADGFDCYTSSDTGLLRYTSTITCFICSRHSTPKP